MSSVVTCSLASGRVATVTAVSRTVSPIAAGRGRTSRRSAAIVPVNASSGTGARRSAGASSDRRAQLPRASIGNQATAKGGGTDTSTAASGRAAVSWPTAIMARSTSHAEPPRNQPSASPIGPAGMAPRTRPPADAVALASIASGTNGTTSTFEIGATSDSRSKFTRMTGSVVSWAASVSATGSRSQAGHRPSLVSIDRPNQIRPAVARSESWNPTSHSTAGAASSMTSAARPSADAACARDPPSRPISIAPAMSAARTTDGLAPVSTT